MNPKSRPTDPMLNAIIHGKESPHIGSIPNRFKAVVPGNFNPETVKSKVESKWCDLAAYVYVKYIASVANEYGRDTEAIWNRQVTNIWEIAWVLGTEPGDQSDDHWLDMRKNWRNHWPEPEGGDHCTIMSDFQELSGYTRIKERTRQNAFWQNMQKTAPDDRLDIRDNERLCTIALIKRLFPRLGKDDLAQTIGWTPGGNPATVGNWPSTTYMAVAPWLLHIAGDENRIADLKQYVQTVHDMVNQNNNDYFKKLASEQATRLEMLSPLRQVAVAGKMLDSIDGDLLHQHALKNHRTAFLSDLPIPDSGEDPEPNKRLQLLGELLKLYKKAELKPRSYYALLIMDGDRLGKMLQHENQQVVSRALLAFTGEVQPCVEQLEHSGITIYAGGDDVLALLPLPNALACAVALRDVFVSSFGDVGVKATASAAIIFAHHQVPLRTVLGEAHHQLENIAKDLNGRDSLALAVLKPSGVTASWVSCWGTQTDGPVTCLQELVDHVAAEAFPRGFFHKLRDRYGFYEDKGQSGLPPGLDIHKLLVAEYMQSREKPPTLALAESAVTLLLQACQTASKASTAKRLALDGGFIARFLTQEVD